VINYMVPVERDFKTPAFETYLHRIGRSGRFGRKGAAFNPGTGQTVTPPPPLWEPTSRDLISGNSDVQAAFECWM